MTRRKAQTTASQKDQASHKLQKETYLPLLAVRKVPASPESSTQHLASVKSQALCTILPQAWAAGEELTITQKNLRKVLAALLDCSDFLQSKPEDKKHGRREKRQPKLCTWLGSSLSWWAGRSSSCRATVTCQNHRGWGAAGPASLWNSGSSSGALCGCNVLEDKRSGKKRIIC